MILVMMQIWTFIGVLFVINYISIDEVITLRKKKSKYFYTFKQ